LYVKLGTLICRNLSANSISQEFPFLKSVSSLRAVLHVQNYSTFMISQGGHDDNNDHLRSKRHKAAVQAASISTEFNFQTEIYY
jgi:hypothetical protein